MMDAREQVLATARDRAAALVAGDAQRLGELLDANFHWTSHTGEQFDRDTYLDANTGGRTAWRNQDLGEPDVIVFGDAAVLVTVVTDTIEGPDGPVSYRMPMTQFWIKSEHRWQCVAGHAGPRLSEKRTERSTSAVVPG
jgi:ketosteroid isomerase-like protein